MSYHAAHGIGTVETHQQVPGIRFLNDPKLPQPSKTVVVYGVGRGGTSAVAGLCRALGVAMPDAHPLQHEWSPVIYSGDRVDRMATWHRFRELDRNHTVWGWKNPRDIFCESQYASMLRNPYAIVVMRNPLDTIASSARAENIHYTSSINDVARVQQELMQFIWSTDLPLALISFERMRSDARPIIQALSMWLGLDNAADNIERAVRFTDAKQGVYRPIDNGEHMDLEFADEDILANQSAAHAALYTKEIEVLQECISNLSSDIKMAEDIRTELYAELLFDQDNLESIKLIIDKFGFDNLPGKNDHIALPEQFNIAGAYNNMENLYYQLRACFLDLKSKRRNVQTQLDSICCLLGRSF